MKHYEVRMTMTVATTVCVDAEDEESAEELAKEKASKDEAYYLSNYDCIWEREVIEVNEEEQDDDDLGKALNYVRENMDADDIAVIRAQVGRNMNNRMPAEQGVDEGQIIDLLEEYGQDNDLAEGWWEEYGDIDDVLQKL